jgi:uncharacterized protein (DUF1778 family)
MNTPNTNRCTASAGCFAISEQHKIVLSERDWNRFLELLDVEIEPTEAAKKATAKYNNGRSGDTTAYTFSCT